MANRDDSFVRGVALSVAVMIRLGYPQHALELMRQCGYSVLSFRNADVDPYDLEIIEKELFGQSPLCEEGKEK